MLVYLLLVLSFLNSQLILSVEHLPTLIFRTNELQLHQLASQFQEIFNDTASKNPNYLQVYFSGAERRTFIASNFPSIYLNAYDTLRPGAYKADLWRLLVVYYYGGFYADAAIRFVESIDHYLNVTSDDALFVIDEDSTAVCNGIFYARRHSPIIRFMIDWIMDNIFHQRYGCNNLDITGPKAIGRALKRILNQTDITSYQVGSFNTTFGSTIQFVIFKKQEVFDKEHRLIMRNKFPGYAEIMRQQSVVSAFTNDSQIHEPYGILYYYRAVFAHDYQQTIADKYAGGLVRWKKQYWLVLNGSRHAFPNYDMYVQMGMGPCYDCAGNSIELLTQIPEGLPLSLDVEGNRQWYRQSVFPQLEFNQTYLLSHHYLPIQQEIQSTLQLRTIPVNLSSSLSKFPYELPSIITYQEFQSIEHYYSLKNPRRRKHHNHRLPPQHT
jgi:hypothetical protein